MKRTAFSLLATAALLLTAANPASAAKEGEIELLTDETAAVTAGDTVWLAINWTAEDAQISDVAVVLRKDANHGVEVSYPTNTASFTGLMNDAQLEEGEIDFTALRVHVPSSVEQKKVDLHLEVGYTTDGERKTENVKVEVPVVQYAEGEHLVQHESSAEVAQGSAMWVDVDMTGMAPMVEAITMTVSGPLDTVYPAYGSSTSLHGDHRLQDGETDTARFRVDPGEAAPGTYELATELTYEYGGTTHVRPGLVHVTVTG